MNREREKQEGKCKALSVLLFDTNPTDLIRQAEPLEARGFDVCKCMTVETALRCVEREDFEFAVVDQGSRAFESLRVLRHLVRYNLRTRFVVVAEQEDPRCRDDAFALGAADYLQKPLSTMKLNSILQKCFGSLAGHTRGDG
jgi:ActR/RegA family two-component response regulator